MTPRSATPADIAEIVELLDMMHAEIGQFPINRQKVRETVEELLETGFVAVLEANQCIIGTIGAYAWQPWYSDQTMLSDQFVFIRPEYRSWPAFKLLVNTAIRVAEHNDMPFLLQLYAVKDTARKEFLFQKFADQLVRGYQFTPVGGLFKKEA